VKLQSYEPEPGIQVLLKSQKPNGPARGHLVMVHGLESSADAGYLLSLSHASLLAGYAAHRFSMRGCAGPQSRPVLYHAGLTSDLLTVLRHLHSAGLVPLYLVGFSLGGNVVLKLAGELAGDARGLLQGICAVSTPIDLGACVERIGQPDNWIYQRRFVRKMCRRLRDMDCYTPHEYRRLQTIFEIDDVFTARAFGFGDARRYYDTQSAARYLERIRVPTLLIQARDDTFVPFAAFEKIALRQAPCITLLATEHGGHLGFLARTSPRFWLDGAIVDWLQENSGTNPIRSSSLR
jgi:predicted alpha/beta-fold hydrolase